MSEAAKMKKTKEIIREYIAKCGSEYAGRNIKRDFPNEYKKIIKYTSKIENEKYFCERLYCVLNDIKDRPKCEKCKKNKVSFINFNNGYHKYCSRGCAQDCEEHKVKIRKAFLKKYGVTGSFCIKENRDAAIDSLKEKLKSGGKILRNKIQKKTRETNLKKYGNEVPMRTKKIKLKKKKTMIEKYGVEYNAQSKENLQKMKKTNLEKYGYEFAMQNPKVIKKTQKTKIKNGTTFYYICPSIGRNEKEILDKQESIDNCKIDRDFKILNYKPDGYCHETNTIYEVYEKKHREPTSKRYDFNRQRRIQRKLKCRFVKIWDLSQ